MAESQLKASYPSVQGDDTSDGGESVSLAGDIHGDEEAYSFEGGDVSVDLGGLLVWTIDI